MLPEQLPQKGIKNSFLDISYLVITLEIKHQIVKLIGGTIIKIFKDMTIGTTSLVAIKGA